MASTIRIPVDFRNPRVSSLQGNSFWNPIALSSIDLGIWEFLPGVDGRIYGIVSAPSNLAITPAPAIELVIGANATVGVTRMNIDNLWVARDSESYDVSLTLDTAQDVTVPGTARNTRLLTFTGGDLANILADEMLILSVLHEGSNVNDTLAVNTELLESYLRVDIN